MNPRISLLVMVLAFVAWGYGLGLGAPGWFSAVAGGLAGFFIPTVWRALP